MPIDKRAIRREFKERKTDKGVFAVRCTISGEAWVSGSKDLKASQTGIWFGLRNGMHHNRKMQAAWNTHGADSFQFEVLESFDDDTPPLLLSDALRDRQKHWKNELGASML